MWEFPMYEAEAEHQINSILNTNIQFFKDWIEQQIENGHKLGMGQGDCDDSSECRDGLTCFNKDKKKIESYNQKVEGYESCEKIVAKIRFPTLPNTCEKSEDTTDQRSDDCSLDSNKSEEDVLE